jgi:hypothetical protein
MLTSQYLNVIFKNVCLQSIVGKCAAAIFLVTVDYGVTRGGRSLLVLNVKSKEYRVHTRNTVYILLHIYFIYTYVLGGGSLFMSLHVLVELRRSR